MRAALADVRTSPFTSNPFMHGNSIQGDRYFLTQATMIDLIATAHGADATQTDESRPMHLSRPRRPRKAQ